LVASGAFDEERVELLDGMLVAMSPQGSLHATVVERLHAALVLALHSRQAGARVRSQSPLSLGDASEPEPDVAVVASDPAGKDFAEHPNEALLVVEVADSSLQNREIKARLYASAAIPEYWIVVLPTGVVEVRDQPAGGVYRRLRTVESHESIRLVALPGVEIHLEEILPRA
jgi:Uma2 family endonuclease